MKVVFPKDAPTNGKKTLLLPLESQSEDSLDKYNSRQYELLSDPNDSTSHKYKISIRVLEYGCELRPMIKWKKGLFEMLTGTGSSTAAPVRNMCKLSLIHI